MMRKTVGLVYDLSMTQKHSCLWDATHIEIPERLGRILQRLELKGLLEQCQILPPLKSSVKDIRLVHSLDYAKKIESAKNLSPEELESLAGEFEDIYLDNGSYEQALLSAGCALQATNALLQNRSHTPTIFAFSYFLKLASFSSYLCIHRRRGYFVGLKDL